MKNECFVFGSSQSSQFLELQSYLWNPLALFKFHDWTSSKYIYSFDIIVPYSKKFLKIIS